MITIKNRFSLPPMHRSHSPLGAQALLAKLLTLGAALLLALGVTAKCQAITISTTDFIANASRTYFNGFEGMPQTSTGAPSYTENNIRVEQINGQGNDIWSSYLSWGAEGNRAWYPNGGDSGYTRITLLDGSDLGEIVILRGSGNGGHTTLIYELYENGSLVLTGTVTHTVNARYLGFSGAGFDEIRLRDTSSAGDTMNSHTHNALAIDSIEVRQSSPAPEIAVEQPVGTNVPDGGNKSFGGVSVGANTSLTFTIRNTGNADLTGLGITVDGLHAAMFSVTANPTAPVSPGGSTTFTIRFAPASVGAKTAALHIAHNDTDENPFDITLTGTGVYVNTAPVANAGGPYTINQGADLQLDGSGSFDFDVPNGDTFTGSWDLNNDGAFDDATGLSPKVPYATLGGLGLTLGTYTISLRVTDAAGASSTSRTTLTVQRAAQTIEFSSIATRAYGGAPFTLTASASSGLPVSFTSLTPSVVTVSANTATIVGSGTARIRASQSGNANYLPAPDADQTFIVSEAAITVTPDDFTRNYGEPTPPLTGTLIGVVNGDNITASYETTATPASMVGVYAIYPVLHDPDDRLRNYTIKELGATFKILLRPIEVTANPGQTKGYGTADPSAFSYTITSGSLAGSDTLNGTLTRVAGENVGAYAIQHGTLTAGGNYTLTYVQADFAITPAALAITANNRGKTYGQTVVFAGTEFTASGLVNGDAVTSVTLTSPGAAAGATVGSYAIAPSAAVGSGLGNYTISYVGGTLTVGRAALMVAAQDQSRVFGQPNPAFTGSTTGLQNGDQFPVSFTCSATESSYVGAYPIVPSIQDQNGKLSNYSVSLVNGTLTITPAAIEVTIQSPESGFLQTISTAIDFIGSFTPTGNSGPYSAHWTVSSATVAETIIPATVNGLNVSAQIQFPTPGIYLIALSVEDAADLVGEADLVRNDLPSYIVIYDPNGGFVTGGGWINSPAGAFHPSLQEFAGVTGKASFGFVAKYLKGAQEPTGNTEFQFKAGNLNFKSTAYQWLTVAGARAQYKGWGTINGQGEYAFMLTAIDGALLGGSPADRFRIKIWADATGAVIYDNQAGGADTAELDNNRTTIGGGSIVIHR